MRRALVVLAFAAAVSLAAALPALAYDEPHNMPEQHTGAGGVTRDCVPCHRAGPDGTTCDACHSPHPPLGLGETGGKGPHGVYSATTDRCDACHDAHAAGGSQLLMSTTVTQSCWVCHDGTGGKGVYGAIAMRGVAVGARHRIDTTNAVPGGSASDGATATMSFGGPGGTLGCDDCHSPHDANTVEPYGQERLRTSFNPVITYNTKTSKLLRRNPGGSTATATVYGSDWCLACHKGRASGGALHNHPVESKATTPNPNSYANVALLSSDSLTSVTTTGSMARTNRGYLMPYPRTPQQAGHGPICQQCHEDSRNVGVLSDDGLSADAATFSVTVTDGLAPADNPRFQNFPHESVNRRLLVEKDDDLCLNCHPPRALP